MRFRSPINASIEHFRLRAQRLPSFSILSETTPSFTVTRNPIRPPDRTSPDFPMPFRSLRSLLPSSSRTQCRRVASNRLGQRSSMAFVIGFWLLIVGLIIATPVTTWGQTESKMPPMGTGTSTPNPMAVPRGSETAVVAEIPDFHLTQVQLNADVVADRVNLVATIEVMINRGENWHRVPLRLSGLHVFRREYVGTGEEAADVSPRSADDGLVWLFKGVGKHQLKLHAWVPLTRTVTGGQFQVSLPALPAQFEARLTATIPTPSAIVRSTKNMTVLEVSRTAQQTVVEASVVGNLLVFAWQTPVAGGETIPLVQSWLHLKPSAEHLSLIVEQNIELQQTTSDTLEITTPPGFRLVNLSGQHYRSHEFLTDPPNRVRVKFANENLERLTLHWGFEREFSPTGGVLQLEGFQVQGAIREEGRIRIDEFENLLMVPHPMESQLVHSIGVNQVRALGTGVPLAAYEYLRQPFRLEFEVQPSVPYYSVEPVNQIRFLKDAIELTVSSRVRFERGSVSELKLHWPNWQEENWRVISVDANTNRTGPLAYDVTSQPGYLRLWWTNPLGRREGDATLTVVLRRPFNGTENSQVTMTLPTPVASEVEPAIVKLESADQLSVELLGPESNPLPRLSNPTELSDLGLSSTTNHGEPAPRFYRVARPEETIVAKVETHEREIRAQSVVAIRDITDGRLHVDQSIHFDVSYGRLRLIEIVIPPELKKFIPDSAITQGVVVTYQGERLSLLPGRTPDLLLADLGTEKIGSFNINVAYSFPVAAEQGTQDVDLPIIQLKEIPYQRLECVIDAVDSAQVRSGKTEWEALQTSPSDARWINSLKNGPVSLIPLTIGSKLADSSQQFVVEQVQLRTIFAADGNTENWAEFQLLRPQGRLVLDFPLGTQFKEDAFQADGKPLPTAPVLTQLENSVQVTLQLPPSVSEHPIVTVRYRMQLPSAFGLTNQFTWPFPRFKGSVWVDRTVWEMQLPQGTHLFTYPDLLPQFQWTRHYLIWYRESTPAYQAERVEQTHSQVPPEFQFDQRTYYAFRGFGPISQVTFRSMNRSLILLVGAGFAMFLGFLFWNFPATRNVFSLIVIFFLFAVASLYFVEPMLLLLQPAIFGLVLALAATVIDSSSRRRTMGDRFHSHLERPVPHTPPPRSPEGIGDSSLRSMTTRIYRPAPASKSDRLEG